VKATALEDGRTEVLFTVSDTGIGIPANKLGQLFQAFSQADGSITRRFGGTGLGLAISRRLAEMMGGRIWARSEEGKGAIVSFSLCFSVVPGGNGDELPQIVEAGVSYSAGPLTVLVAEDNHVNQLILKNILRRHKDWRVVAVQNGREAVDAARSERFDLALMDVHMPDTDGFTATAMIRESEEPGQHLPIIALTADAMTGDREKCLAAGMDDYLAKPFKAEELLVRIESALANRKRPRPRLAARPAAQGSAKPLRCLIGATGESIKPEASRIRRY
jgi:CheY-like chemotaxis protein